MATSRDSIAGSDRDPVARHRIRAGLWSALGISLAVALAGCGIGNPEPGPTAASTEHHTLLVIGDSLAGQGDVTLPGQLAKAGLNVTVIDAHQNGTGLIGPVGDQPTALEYVKAVVAAHPEVDTVLIEWAGACFVCGKDGVPAIGEPAFYDAWRANAHAVIDYLHSVGLTVVWVVSPPFGVNGETIASGSQLRVNACTVLSMIDTVDLAPYAAGTGPLGDVNWWHALADTAGHYESFLWYGGAVHQVRTSDLTHFTFDGSARASTWTARGLGDLWGQMPNPSIAAPAGGAPLVDAGDPVAPGTDGNA